MNVVKYEDRFINLLNCFVFVQIHELVDCRDVSIGAWFEGVIENVSPATKGQNGKAETAPPPARVGRPRKQTNGKLDSEETLSSTVTDSNGTSEKQINSDSSEPSTSKTASTNSSEAATYHIKYEE